MPPPYPSAHLRPIGAIALTAPLGAFHAIFSDPRAMAFWYCPPHEDLAVTQAWLAELIGKAGLRKFPAIGFIFHPDVWGRGLASEAIRPIIDRAFNEHGIPMIEADVDPRNEPSLRLLNRLGFMETGRAERTSIVGDEWCDSVFLRLYSANSDGS